jgi:hypothetical protein
MPTTFRADIRAGLLTIIDAYITANPTLLRKRFRSRPPSVVNDLPYAYIDFPPETVTHDSGTRTRAMDPAIVLVDQPSDNGEVLDRFDVLTDSFLDHLSDYPHVASNTIWSRMTVTQTTEEHDDRPYPAVRFAFDELSIMEGRS